MSMDYELILRNGFGWIKDTKIWLYIALLIVIGLSLLVGSALLIEESIGKLLAKYISSGDIATALFSLINTIIILILAFILVGLIQGFVYTLMILKGMNYYKIKTRFFGIGEYIKLIILYIFSFFAALISYYNKKFLLFFVGIVAVWFFAFAALFVSPGLGVMLMFVGFVLWIPYFFIVIYNSFRLSMAPFVFLEQGDIFASLKKSYEITAGKVVDIFLAILIISGIIWVIVFIADQIGQTLLFAFFPELTGIQEMGLQQEAINPLQAISLVSSLMENLAEMIILSGVISTMVSGITSAFSAYSYAGIYSQVKKK